MSNSNYNKLRKALGEIVEGRKKDGYTELDASQFATERVACLAALAQLTPGHQLYGHMYLYIQYGEDIYAITWLIHLPMQKFASLSNRPRWIKQLTWNVSKKVFDFEYWTLEDTDFASEAFWLNTPDRYLPEPDRDIKQVFKKARSWCAKNQMCAKLRKTDRKHLAIISDKNAERDRCLARYARKEEEHNA